MITLNWTVPSNNSSCCSMDLVVGTEGAGALIQLMFLIDRF